MKIFDIKNIVEQGKHIVIRFNADADNYIEESIDSNMIGKIVGVTSEYLDEDCLTLHIDLNDYEKHNRTVAKRDWFDSDGKPTLTWFDTGMYPKNGIAQVVFDIDLELEKVFKIVEENSLMQEYSADKSELTYVEWLENLVLQSRSAETR